MQCTCVFGIKSKWLVPKTYMKACESTREIRQGYQENADGATRVHIARTFWYSRLTTGRLFHLPTDCPPREGTYPKGDDHVSPQKHGYLCRLYLRNRFIEGQRPRRLGTAGLRNLGRAFSRQQR